MKEIDFTGQLDIFSKKTKKQIKGCGKCGNLSSLNEEEYYNFSLYVKNNSDRPFSWKEAYVQVNRNDRWRWSAGQIMPGTRCVFPISYQNALTFAFPGTYEVVWYFDGRPVHTEYFCLSQTMDWNKVFSIPSTDQIQAYRNPNQRRSPYISGWMEIPAEVRYTEYMIDFRVGHLPKGTYVCLGNWKMDQTALYKKYESVRTYAGINAYAGFQRIADGSTTAIMSFWDMECVDRKGKKQILKSQRLHPPKVLNGGRFGGEGDGERSNIPFEWEAGHWYRMHLKSIPSKEQNGTLVEQWVSDLETGTCQLLTRFLFPVPNSAFQGSIAIFLENFLPETAGEVRTLEVCNVKYFDAFTRSWKPAKIVILGSRGGVPAYEGSYNFGVMEDHIYMITSGVGGDWFGNGRGKKTQRLQIRR